MNIIYENEDLIFVIKPRGVSSQGDMLAKLSEHTGNEAYCVHRLDTVTGGIMVYAKNRNSAAILSKSFAENGVDKEYFAVVKGTPVTADSFTDLLWHDKIKNKSFVVNTKRKGAKEARLSYKLLCSDGERSMVSVKLYTGRTHQIRIQFASRGFPLYGDGKYGGKSGYPLALWCHRLTVPYKGKTYEFSCPPPEEETIWNFQKESV